MTIETLPAPLAQAIAQRGYEELTPVQSAVIAEEARLVACLEDTYL